MTYFWKKGAGYIKQDFIFLHFSSAFLGVINDFMAFFQGQLIRKSWKISLVYFFVDIFSIFIIVIFFLKIRLESCWINRGRLFLLLIWSSLVIHFCWISFIPQWKTGLGIIIFLLLIWYTPVNHSACGRHKLRPSKNIEKNTEKNT